MVTKCDVALSAGRTLADRTKEHGEVMTMLPPGASAAMIARCSPAVRLEAATACSRPNPTDHFAAYLSTMGPPRHVVRLVSPTKAMRSDSIVLADIVSVVLPRVTIAE